MSKSQTKDINQIDNFSEEAVFASAAPSVQMSLLDGVQSDNTSVNIVNIVTGFHGLRTIGANKHFPFSFTVNALTNFSKAVCNISVSGFSWPRSGSNDIQYHIMNYRLQRRGQLLIVKGTIYCHDDNASVEQLSYSAFFSS